MHTLETLAEWLESARPPDRETATVLLKEVIPAALDAAVAELHLKSVALLRRASELAGLPLPDEEPAQAVVPASCAVCPDAKHVYSFGAHILRCKGGDDPDATREDLARIEGDVAFRQPTELSKAQLLEQAAERESPAWCPRR